MDNLGNNILNLSKDEQAKYEEWRESYNNKNRVDNERFWYEKFKNDTEPKSEPEPKVRTRFDDIDNCILLLAKAVQKLEGDNTSFTIKDKGDEKIKKEIKTEKPIKYIFVVKERYIHTELRLQPSDTLDKDFTISRYPERTNPDIVFDTEEDANNYVIKRKEQIKIYKEGVDFPLNDYYNSFCINEQHIFTVSKELVI